LVVLIPRPFRLIDLISEVADRCVKTTHRVKTTQQQFSSMGSIACALHKPSPQAMQSLFTPLFPVSDFAYGGHPHICAQGQLEDWQGILFPAIRLKPSEAKTNPRLVLLC
jgi:hypothetical protein